MAYGGSLHFNPLTDTLPLPDGGTFRFSAPQGDISHSIQQRAGSTVDAPNSDVAEVAPRMRSDEALDSPLLDGMGKLTRK
jgi:hypothetical protein